MKFVIHLNILLSLPLYYMQYIQLLCYIFFYKIIHYYIKKFQRFLIMTCKRAKQEVVEVVEAIFSVKILSSFLFASDSDTEIA